MSLDTHLTYTHTRTHARTHTHTHTRTHTHTSHQEGHGALPNLDHPPPCPLLHHKGCSCQQLSPSTHSSSPHTRHGALVNLDRHAQCPPQTSPRTRKGAHAFIPPKPHPAPGRVFMPSSPPNPTPHQEGCSCLHPPQQPPRTRKGMVLLSSLITMPNWVGVRKPSELGLHT